jgi:hypothetical protein
MGQFVIAKSWLSGAALTVAAYDAAGALIFAAAAMSESPASSGCYRLVRSDLDGQQGHFIFDDGTFKEIEAFGNPDRLAAVYDAAKTAATQISVDAIPTNPLLDDDSRLDNLDATVSSRHASGAPVAKSPATLDWSADVTNKPTIGTSTLDAAGVRSAVGMAEADLDEQLAALAEGDTTAAEIRAAIGMEAADLDAQLAAVKVKTDLITTQGVFVQQSIGANGAPLVIYRGDDMDESTGRYVDVTLPAGPDLTDAAASLVVRLHSTGAVELEAAGELQPGTRTFRFSLPAADTSVCTAGVRDHDYAVNVTLDGGLIWTPFIGIQAASVTDNLAVAEEA